MSFTSYAQNFEDVMLWRALGHVPRGFYIDVGANDPTVDSVTLAFYERGWSGINVEPTRQFHERLAAARPRDTNLQLAVGDAPGELTLFEVPDTGLSTLDAAIAASHAQAGRAVRQQQVRVTTLADICERHVGGPIHFLKVDVEGLEAAVLRGMDFTRWRPWVLVIEATRPQSQVASDEEWRTLVESAGYACAYFDGLNRFYVAGEHAELAQSFAAPPNYFDDFKLREGHWYSWPTADLERRVHLEQVRAAEAEARAADSETRTAKAETRAAEASQRAAALEGRVQELRHRLAAASDAAAEAVQRASEAESAVLSLRGLVQAIHESTSWRVTAPLRWAGHQWIELRRQGPRERMRRAVRKLARMPGAATTPPDAPAAMPPSPGQPELSPEARRIHDAIERAVDAQAKTKGKH